MKTTIRLALLFGLVTVAAAQPTASPTPSPAGPPALAPAGDFAALDRFLTLSDAELGQMAEAIARVRAMTPAQRAAMRGQIAAYCALPESQRMRIRQGWGWMPPEIQDGWREMMQNATPEERAAIQSRMQSLPPSEKLKYRRELVEAYLKAKSRQP